MCRCVVYDIFYSPCCEKNHPNWKLILSNEYKPAERIYFLMKVAELSGEAVKKITVPTLLKKILWNMQFFFSTSWNVQHTIEMKQIAGSMLASVNSVWILLKNNRFVLKYITISSKEFTACAIVIIWAVFFFWAMQIYKFINTANNNLCSMTALTKTHEFIPKIEQRKTVYFMRRPTLIWVIQFSCEFFIIWKKKTNNKIALFY